MILRRIKLAVWRIVRCLLVPVPPVKIHIDSRELRSEKVEQETREYLDDAAERTRKMARSIVATRIRDRRRSEKRRDVG